MSAGWRGCEYRRCSAGAAAQENTGCPIGQPDVSRQGGIQDCEMMKTAVARDLNSSQKIIRLRQPALMLTRPGLYQALVQGFARGASQPLDLVLDHQFPALQFDNLQIVRGKMHKCVVQFIFENLVFPFQFNEMRLHCHTKPPRWN
jgi:hypothetical protein